MGEDGTIKGELSEAAAVLLEQVNRVFEQLESSKLRFEIEVDECLAVVATRVDLPVAVAKRLRVNDYGQTAAIFGNRVHDVVAALAMLPELDPDEGDRVTFVIEEKPAAHEEGCRCRCLRCSAP